MKKLLIIIFFATNIAYGQMVDNTATLNDTSGYKNIRDRISDETIFINFNPNGEHYYNRGLLKGKIADYEGAMADLNKSIELNANEFIVYYARAAVKEKMGDLMGARADFTKAIELNPTNILLWNERAQVNINLQRFDEAEADLRKAMKQVPEWMNPVFNLGRLYEKKKDFVKAIEYYSQSIKLDSSNYMAYNNIGVIYFGLKKYDLSIAYFTQAIAVFPEYLNAYRSRADAKRAKGDHDGACQDLKAAADLGDTQALKFYNDQCLKK